MAVEQRFPPESAAAYDPDWDRPYPQYQPVGKVLLALPDSQAGRDLPAGSLDLRRRRPVLVRLGRRRWQVRRSSSACARRTSPRSWKSGTSTWPCATTSPAASPEVTMTRGKPLPVGPGRAAAERGRELGGAGGAGADGDPPPRPVPARLPALVAPAAHASAISSFRRAGPSPPRTRAVRRRFRHPRRLPARSSRRRCS